MKKKYPAIECEKVILKTTGDRILDRPLSEFGGKGVFITELEKAIQDGTIDYAVHSAKDMPMELRGGLAIVSVLERGDARDVLVTKRGFDMASAKSAVIGSGSSRRVAQFAKLYPNAAFCGLRGNVTTRLHKLREGQYDGILLAAAGLSRLHLLQEEDLCYTFFDLWDMVPAGGQAIIAVEGRAQDDQRFLCEITDEKTALELDTERNILRKLSAGCHEAVGVFAKITEFSESDITGKMPKTGLSMPGCLMSKSTGGRKKKRSQIEVMLMQEVFGEIIKKRKTAPLADREAVWGK